MSTSVIWSPANGNAQGKKACAFSTCLEISGSGIWSWVPYLLHGPISSPAGPSPLLWGFWTEKGYSVFPSILYLLLPVLELTNLQDELFFFPSQNAIPNDALEIQIVSIFLRLWACEGLGCNFPQLLMVHTAQQESLSLQPILHDRLHPPLSLVGFFRRVSRRHGFSCLKKKSLAPWGRLLLDWEPTAFRACWLQSHFADWKLWGVFICRKQLWAEGEWE